MPTTPPLVITPPGGLEFGGRFRTTDAEDRGSIASFRVPMAMVVAILLLPLIRLRARASAASPKLDQQP